jgi:hypothetical protein
MNDENFNVVDLHCFDADPDPTFHFDADPDPKSHTCWNIRMFKFFHSYVRLNCLIFFSSSSTIIYMS